MTAAEAPARLALNNVSVTLAGAPIVRSVTADLKPARLVALVGPNGAGKTTLLRALAGLLPMTGQAVLDTHDLAGMKPEARARRMSYLPQGHQVHWPMRARDVVALGRYPHGGRDPSRLSEEDSRIVALAMQRTECLSLADRNVQTLSGGERARVMMARVFAVEAPVLLADEPTAALDPRHQLAIIEALLGEAERGTLVIAVTHDLMLASRFAHEVLVMHEGALAASGAPAAVFTPRLLADVYGVQAATINVDGQPVTLPWSRT
ncbi:MAG: ABC transporter ATP-binding protein [Beijerinckiaceae bacterium]